MSILSDQAIITSFSTSWSIFLFLGVPNLKLRIIIITLPTDRPKIILPTAHTTKIKLPSPYEDIICFSIFFFNLGIFFQIS